MSWIEKYLKSSIGAKHVMAVTGLLLAGFVLVHMLGNLSIFLGRDSLNTYAEDLQSQPALLWGGRAVLLALLVVHVAASLRLVALNKAARPVKYRVFRPTASPFYARAMPMTGLIVFAFIVYHLLHFTTGAIMSDAYHSYEVIDRTAGISRHDVYTMVVLGFQNVPVALSYIVAMALLCMHLSHGVSSMFQSVGLSHPRYRGFVRGSGPVFAIIIFVGNCSMPLAVMTGAIQ